MSIVDDWVNDMDDGRFDGIREILFERIEEQVQATRGELLAYWDEVVRFAVISQSGFHDHECPPVEAVEECLRKQLDNIAHHVKYLLIYRAHD